ncbi:Tat-linked quality control protein TatD [compost metagenome]
MQFLDIHTHQSIQQKGVISIQSLSVTDDCLLKIPTHMPLSLGLHPWYAKLSELEAQMNVLTVIVQQDNVKLIGECGLDKLKGEKLENQLLILMQQIKLAENLNKPLILHCVKCFDELVKIKQQDKVKVPMIIHGFNKSFDLGKQMLHKGFYLSFGKAVLNGNKGVAKLIETSDHFFLETDDSGFAIEEIYAAVANLKKCSVDELKARIFADWNKLITKG